MTETFLQNLLQISKKAGDRLMESICLEYLLSLISRQGKVWNESDHANKFLDGECIIFMQHSLYVMNTYFEVFYLTMLHVLVLLNMLSNFLVIHSGMKVASLQK